MNGIETPRASPAITKSWCFVDQNGLMRFTRLYGSIALPGLLEHFALPMLSLEPMQTKPTSILCTHPFSSLSCDPLALLVLLRHVRHRKCYSFQSSQPSVNISTVFLSASAPHIFPVETTFTYPVVNSASTYPPFPHPSTPTCTESDDIGP